MNLWRTISDDGTKVVLNKFSGFDLPHFDSIEGLDQAEIKVGCAVDLETTGLDWSRDGIIEIGLRVFYFEPNGGQLHGIGSSVSQMQDPGRPLDSAIAKLTGIKSADLKGQSIDWNSIRKIFDSCSLIVAHNAQFDRPFIDRQIKYSERPVWACSMKQIDWLKFGFTSSNLQLLTAFHGYFSDAHRALSDADMVVNLLRQNPKYVLELYENAHAPRVILRLSNTSYNSRTLLKRSGFRWNPVNRTWSKTVTKKSIGTEIQSLNEIYMDREPEYQVLDIPLSENFKV